MEPTVTGTKLCGYVGTVFYPKLVQDGITDIVKKQYCAPPHYSLIARDYLNYFFN